MKLMIWGLGCGFRAREPRGDPPTPAPLHHPSALDPGPPPPQQSAAPQKPPY